MIGSPPRSLRSLRIWPLIAATFAGAAAAQPSGEVWRLGTASETSGYYAVAERIAEIAREAGLDVRIEPVATSGSVDNIRRMAAGELEMAVVQNDIGFMAEQGLPPFEAAVDGLRGLAMLYREPVYLVTDGSVRRLRPPLNVSVAVGREGSGTYVNARTILQAADVWDPLSAVYTVGGGTYPALRDGTVGIGFVNELSPEFRADLDRGALRFVPLPLSLVNRLRGTYPYFVPYQAKTATDSSLTVAVRAMLVGQAGLDTARVAALVGALADRYGDVAAVFPDTSTVYGAASITETMPLEAWHEGAARVLGTEPGLLARYGWALWSLLGAVAGGYLAMNVLLLAFGRLRVQPLRPGSLPVRATRAVNRFIFERKYLLLALVVLGTFVSILLAIEILERQWAIQNNSVSPFAERPLHENLLWLFVFGAGGYEGGVFPEHAGGRLLATLIPLIGATGFFGLIGLLTSDKIRDYMMESHGLKRVTFEDHILICGWSQNVPYLVGTLRHRNVIDPPSVVVLSQGGDDAWVRQVAGEDGVQFVRGCATSRDDLDRANFEKAATAIVIADEGADDPDAQTILKVLTIESHSRHLREGTAGPGPGGKARPPYDRNIYTIAEIVKPDNEPIARDAEVDEIISLGEIQAKLFAQSAHNHGVSRFVSEILEYNDLNDVYSHRVVPGLPLDGRTFDELLGPLRAGRALLVAIHRGREAGCDDTDVGRAVMTNPLGDHECAYRTQPGDVLLMLAKDGEAVARAVAEARARLRDVPVPDGAGRTPQPPGWRSRTWGGLRARLRGGAGDGAPGPAPQPSRRG